ncbi:GAF domain-containing protein [Lentzea sp.]|uniref:GAF domain-containing protein n=1 Tax=Lentzea sp. TaxID=56099 RepID=UPI002ED4BF54
MLDITRLRTASPEGTDTGPTHRQTIIRHVCIACGVRTNAVGAALYLREGAGRCRPFTSSGFCGEEIAELQTVLGEGPAFEAARQNWPVLVPNLVDHRTSVRWPLFAGAAVAAGVEAIFAFPFSLGEDALGVLEVHRDHGDPLTPDEIVGAVQLADVALALLLDAER